MGASRQKRPNANKGAVGNQQSTASHADSLISEWVTKLQAVDHEELEEVCSQIAYYATKHSQHAALVTAGIPHRLLELLMRLSTAANAGDCSAELLRASMSTSEALRNCITNSSHDQVMDMLCEPCDPDGTCCYSRVLFSEIQSNWARLGSLRSACLEQCGQEEASSLEKVTTEYFTVTSYHRELMELLVVSIDGSEVVANHFSNAPVLHQLLETVRLTHCHVRCTLRQEPSVFQPDDALSCLQLFQRQDTHALALLTASIGDVFLRLSTDNELLMHFFVQEATDGTTTSPQQKSWLNTVVSSAAELEWLESSGGFDMTSPARLQDGSVGELQLMWAAIQTQLVHFTLALQGMLIHVSPVKANLVQVLPLAVKLLSLYMPVNQWRLVLPLLRDGCEIEESTRSAAVRLVSERLLASKAAVDLLSSCVSLVCEGNAEDKDDEVAFQENPLSSILVQSNALFAFGQVLKDTLWLLDAHGNELCALPSEGTDNLQLAELRALRLSTQSNAEVTSIQFTIMSSEVEVWNLATTLLLMMPINSLGNTAVIWRALVQAVHHRSELIRSAEEGNTSVVYNVAKESPAAVHLMWLQLKSLLQILWTLQRKESTSQDVGSILNYTNTLAAVPSDVDLLARLSWESGAPAELCQACAATVGLICSSFQSPDAIGVASRYLLALIQHSGGQNRRARRFCPNATSVDQLENSVVLSPIPNAAEAPLWLERLQTADGIVHIRCEAVNTLIDLFSDERYDQAVYVPLNIQQCLELFLRSVSTYIKNRKRLERELWKLRGFATATFNASVCEEIAENLSGFLSYKRQNIRA